MISYSEPGPSSLSRKLGVTSSGDERSATLFAGGGKVALAEEEN